MTTNTFIRRGTTVLALPLLCLGLTACKTINEGPKTEFETTAGPMVTNTVEATYIKSTPLPEKIQTKTPTPGESSLRHDKPDEPLYKP